MRLPAHVKVLDLLLSFLSAFVRFGTEMMALAHRHNAWFDVVLEHASDIKHTDLIRVDMEFILMRRLDSTHG